jgi:AraC family transcriptional regulator
MKERGKTIMLQTIKTQGYSQYAVPPVNYEPQRWNPNTRSPSSAAPQRASAIELSLLNQEEAVASSDALGWQHVRLIELRHGLSEMVMPSSAGHCIVLPLGASLHLSARLDGHNFEGDLLAGEIAIIPAGLSWSCRSQDEESQTTLLLYLQPLFVRTTADECDLAYREIALAPQIGFSNAHILNIAKSLLYEMKEANVVGRLYADSLAVVLAMEMVRCYSSLKDVQIGRGGMAPHKLRKAIELIDNHLADEEEGRVALRVVAREVGMSYYHFSRAFKQSMGVNPTNYITGRRIEHAKKLLEETDLPIAEIALRAGFSSQSHFTTSFRRVAGATPKAFRAII